jgi:hypothetical protein
MSFRRTALVASLLALPFVIGATAAPAARGPAAAKGREQRDECLLWGSATRSHSAEAAAGSPGPASRHSASRMPSFMFPRNRKLLQLFDHRVSSRRRS